LATLLGQRKIGSVVLATTMWRTAVNKDKAIGRQEELCMEHWNEMMEIGCRIAKFERTLESAWAIIDMTQDTREEIHDFLLERSKREKEISEIIPLYVRCLSGAMTHRMTLAILKRWRKEKIIAGAVQGMSVCTALNPEVIHGISAIPREGLVLNIVMRSVMMTVCRFPFHLWKNHTFLGYRAKNSSSVADHEHIS
jgi:hypothetical protein